MFGSVTTPPRPVRRAQPADAPLRADFAGRLFVETFGPDNRPVDTAAHVARPFGPPHQARELADPDFVTLVVDGMEAVHAAACTLGGRSIWLSVWEQNPRGIAFDTKCGYRDMGGAIFMLGTDLPNDRVLVVPVTTHGLNGVRLNGDDT